MSMGILEEVNASYEKLSPVQKRIADFIFKYPDQVCFYSLKELSETLGVTEVTILRFTKKIGVQSFVEMKNRLREHLQTRLIHGDGLNRISDHVGGQRVGEQDKEEMFRNFVENEQQVIAKTFEQVSIKDILSAVAIIRQSRMIYIAGTELVTGICSYMTRRFLTLGLQVIDLSNQSRALYNNYLAHATPEDCVIIFSAPGYAKHIVNTARYLGKKKIPQIAITDQSSSPIASYGTTVFACNNHDLFFYNSVMGYMSVANALVYFTAMDNPEETNRLRGKLSEVRSEIGSIDFVKDGL